MIGQKKNGFLYAVLAFVMTFLCLTPLFNSTPLRAESTLREQFEQINVLDDLQSNESFKLTDYPYDFTGMTRKTSLITFVEFAYSANPANQSEYGLYVYIYNPQVLDWNPGSASNKIQMATSYDDEGKPTNYNKFQLKFLSKSEGDYEGLFYKFKVVEHEVDGATFIDRVNSNTRRYDISGFELIENGAQTAVEYGVGGTFTFTGYSKGFGVDVSAESTLACDVNELETISFEVRNTFYRPEVVSGAGEGHQNNLSSVYFSIDNATLEKYGSVQKIKAEWYEYKTQPILVTNNVEVFNAFNDYLGQDVSNVEITSLPYGFGSGESRAIDGSGALGYVYYDFTYNINNNSLTSVGVTPGILKTENNYNSLYYQFYNNDLSAISSDELSSYIYSYNKSFENGYLNLKNNDISADLFESSVDEGRTRGYNIKEFDANEEFNMLSYNTENGAWQNFWNFFLSGKNTTQDYENISPIYQVKAEDLTYGDDYIEDSLYINESDIEDFKAFHQAETAKDRSVVLFRFAVTDYYSQDCYGYQKNTENPNRVNSLGKIGYAAQETVFLDFDIIQLTFNKEGLYTVIPVVASPLDVIADITVPVVGDGDWFTSLLSKIGYVLLIILAIVLIIAFFPQIITLVVKLIIWIVKLPFTIYKKIKGGGKK